MAGKKVEILGVKQVQANLLKGGQRWRKAVEAGLYLEANNLMAASKRLVPVDLGTLKGSGYVTMPHVIGTKTVVEMGYGGKVSNAYAAVQHERLDFRHPDGGQAKYLEAVIDARQPRIASNILKLAKAVFEMNGSPGMGGNPVDPDTGEQLAAAQAIGKALRSLGRKPRATKPRKG